jgi:type I restriction enzyme S subunit
MTIQNTNVPTLRFPEFNENWEKKKLGEYLTFKNGINADKSQYGKGAKFINVLDIINNNTITHDKIIGKVEVSENELKKNEVKYGDILFQRSSETREEVGQSNVYVDETQTATFGGFVIRGQAIQKYNPLFFHYLLKTSSAREEITTKSGGSTRYNIGQETLKEVKIIVPKIPEQEKISTFLTTIDEKIQKISKKKILLEQYKKGVLQKIFNQEFRFKDNNGNDFADWEEKTLGDVLDYEQPTKYLVTDTEYKDEYEIPVLTAGKTFILGYTNETKGIFKDKLPVIIFDDFTTANKFVDFPFKAKSSAMKILHSKNGVSVKFIFEAMQNIDFVIGGHERHWISKYSNLFINLPCLKEQERIANFLSAIDEKINFVNVQLVKTQNYKQGLLQQMFL